MKRPRTMLAILLHCLLCVAAGETVFAGEALQIRVDPRVSHQAIDGFGASDAWQCQFVGSNWPLEKRQRIAELLFSRETNAEGDPKGIGLSIWRYNIGAGTTEQGAASEIANPWRRTECFQNADGTYDWSKQAGQQWFLKAAQKRGVERLLAFSNSPPVHMTRNGKGYAEKGAYGINLKGGKMDDYATFLVDVVQHFQQEGTRFDYLSPVNEPQWAWDDSGQEGTPAWNEEIYCLVRCLSHELHARGLKTQVVIGEAGTIGHAFMHMDRMGLTSDGRDDQARFFFHSASPFYVGDLPNVARVLSAHAYHSVWPLDKQVEYRRMLHKAFEAAGPQLGFWQSEYCILESPNAEINGGGGRDLGMDLALYVARIVHHDLAVAHASSWQWWTAVSQVDYKDGLVYLDDGSKGETGNMGPETLSLVHDGVVRESKLLWTLGNYARFVRPGMVRIKCDVTPDQSFIDGLLASAYRGSGKDVVVVLVNLDGQEAHCDLGSDETVEVYTTSNAANLARSQQSAANITIPARALGTVLLARP